jgi:hypothetical protein
MGQAPLPCSWLARQHVSWVGSRESRPSRESVGRRRSEQKEGRRSGASDRNRSSHAHPAPPHSPRRRTRTRPSLPPLPMGGARPSVLPHPRCGLPARRKARPSPQRPHQPPLLPPAMSPLSAGHRTLRPPPRQQDLTEAVEGSDGLTHPAGTIHRWASRTYVHTDQSDRRIIVRDICSAVIESSTRDKFYSHDTVHRHVGGTQAHHLQCHESF